MSVVDAFVISGLVKSKSEARRLIKQGGAYIEEKRVNSENDILTIGDFKKGELNLRAGKKRYMKLIIE